MRKALRNGWKRLCSVVLAAAMVFTMIPVNAQADASQSILLEEGFESGGTGMWSGKDGAVVSVIKQKPKSGQYCMKISGRTQLFAGAKAEIGSMLQANHLLKASASVRFEDGAEQKRVQLMMKCGNEYHGLGNVELNRGEWGEINGSTIIPMGVDLSDAELYFETPWTPNPTQEDFMDIYVDDVKVEMCAFSDTGSYPSMKELYKDEFLIGTAVSAGTLKYGVYSDFIQRQFSSMTMENEMKPAYVLDEQESKSNPAKYKENVALNFGSYIDGLEYAKKHGIKMRGHTLVWHSQTPEWFFYENFDTSGKLASKQLMLKRMENYIKGVIEWTETNYPGVIYAWDVVNEAVSDPWSPYNKDDMLRQEGSMWYQTIGPEFFPKAFEYARKYTKEYAPGREIKLFYNDYNEYFAEKRDNIVKVLKPVKEAGNIDGVGMQSHISTDWPLEGDNGYMTAVRKFRDELGLEIHVTELDIGLNKDQGHSLEYQGEYYQKFMEALLEEKEAGAKITSVTFWGFSDDLSWRADENCLLLYGDLSRKPSFNGVVNAIGEPDLGYTDSVEGTFNNPVIYADVPDIDIIRVGDAYYMVSTTMHLSPGCPIMKSTDLVNWEIVNYVYDILGDTDAMNLRNGQNMYGNGQWAASLKYNNGTYYVAFNSNTTGTAYLYTTKDIEKGSWTKTDLNGFFHDMSLFFDDNGKAYVLYGGGEIKCAELSDDLKTVRRDTEQTLFNVKNENWGADKIGTGLAGEGTHIIKKGDYYYVFNVCWPEGSGRTEICHRSKTFPSTQWENKVILKANFVNNGVGGGVAQGAVIDTPDGKWYGFMFQDHGAIGRTPVLTDCVWKDGWPMLGKDGDGETVEANMQLPAIGGGNGSLVKSDEFYNDAEPRIFGTQTMSAAAQTYNAPEKLERAATNNSVVELITNGGIETGTIDGWESTPGEGPSKLEAVNTDKANGNYSIYVSERPGTGSGACQNISGKMQVGKTYTISGKLKYTEGPDTKDFLVTLQHGKDYQYRQNLVTIKGKKGEWVDFKGTYTAKDKSSEFTFDPNDLHIFVETGWTQEQDLVNDRMSYYLDEFSVTAPDGNMILNGSFENGTEHWSGLEGANIAVTDREYKEGSHSVAVTGRTACAQGPSQDFSNKLTPGNTYTIEAWVKYNTGVDKKTFNLTIQNGPDYTFRSILGSSEAKRGEWTKISVEWTMPEDAITTQNYLFLETPWDPNPTPEKDLMDFYVDDVSMIEKVNDSKQTAEAGEHDYNGSNLDLVWQWNHNPNNNNWSLTERDGWLRLKTGSKAASLLEARNTLTQRTFGPVCSGSIRMDISNMKNGDVAGLGSLSYNYGYIAVKKEGNAAKLVMVDASENSRKDKDEPVVRASVDCTSNIVYLKENFNFTGNTDGSKKDTVTFYYSFDGKSWKRLGNPMGMSYELKHFMGSKFAIFNYATMTSGGFVDYDYFRVSDRIIGAAQSPERLNASMTDVQGVSGVVNGECEVKLNLDNLAAGSHSSLKASISIPRIMGVEDVSFNTSAIKGEASYTFKNGRLNITVKGDDVSFAAENKLFATIKLKVNSYVDKDQTVQVNADYIRVDNGVISYDVESCKADINLKYLDTKAVAKKLGYGNPIFTQTFGADPYAMEYDGRVYVYMTADEYEYDENGELIENTFGKIKTIRVVSSADLMNWTDHGEIKVAGKDGAAKWAWNSWAPAIAHKTIGDKEKFFLYFANGASGIGVLEGDSPLGPWRDPLGKALLAYGDEYPECKGVVWCFDPAVLVDDDGTGYIYFGGGVPGDDNPSPEQTRNPKTARVAKLTDDMIHIENRESKMIDAPCMFEDSGIFKYNGKYYYSYCSNFFPANQDGYPGTGAICYMVSDNPMGPFTYAGEMFSNPVVWFGTGGNNHHATFVFEGKSYFIYHAQTVAKAEGKDKGYRSTHIDKIAMRSDGTIKPISGTYEGIPQLHTMNPYERIEAETIAWNAGIKVVPCNEPGKLFPNYNMALTDLQDKDWTSVSQLDFGEKGADKFQVSAASGGGRIEVRLDSPEGALIGTVDVPATGSKDNYRTVTCDVEPVTGIRNVFLVFRGSGTETIMNVDYFQFTEKGREDVPEKPADQQISNMNDKIAQAEGLLPDLNGTEREKLQDAITEAKNVLKKDNLTRTELEEALDKLNQAVKGAQDAIEASKSVKEQLNIKIKEAKEQLYNLSVAQKEKLQAVIDEVELVLNKDGATDKEIQDAIDKLETAVKEAADPTNPVKEQLNIKIKEAKEQLDNLSVAQKEKLQAVIDEVELVLNKDGATDKEIQDALDKLEIAIEEAKKPVDDLPKVDETFTASNGVKYTVVAYSSTDKTVTITGTTKELTSLTVPDTVEYKNETFKVTAIADSAFAEQTQLTSAVIGKYVTSIGTEAFYNDKMLAEVTFKGKAVKKIGKNAFKGIKKNATFSMIKTFNSKNVKYRITKCTTSTKQVKVIGTSKKKLKVLNIPATVKYNGMTFKVTTVDKKAFRNQKQLKSVIIGKNVKTIGVSAFEGIKKLASIKFNGTAVKKIGKNAFKGIKKNAVFIVKKSKKAFYQRLLNKAKTKNFKVK